MQITPAMIALIAAASSLVGVAISSLFNLLNTSVTKRFELRKHNQTLAMQAAIEGWKKVFDLAMETSKVQNQKIMIPPLETYILRMAKIAELSNDPDLDETNIRQKLNDIDRVLKIVDDYHDEETKKAKLERRT